VKRSLLQAPLAAALGLAATLAACSGITPTGADGPSGAQRVRTPFAQGTPHASHVTVVIMENRDEDRVVGSSKAPYVNGTLIPAGALLANSHAVGHPSEPNYLALFSGSKHGLHGDPCPENFHSANIASELIAARLTFGGYSESMPYDGFTGCGTKMYARKHNPWVMFDNVPAADNLVYHRFPNKPPALTFVIPNLCNDMHNCTVARGDKWLSNHLPPIVAWNAKNDGLLIVTWDEAAPDLNHTNHIPTFVVGPMVVPGSVDEQDLDHYSVLKTIETIFDVGCISSDCEATPIEGIWQ
jgi:acid phosphatase